MILDGGTQRGDIAAGPGKGGDHVLADEIARDGKIAGDGDRRVLASGVEAEAGSPVLNGPGLEFRTRDRRSGHVVRTRECNRLSILKKVSPHGHAAGEPGI